MVSDMLNLILGWIVNMFGVLTNFTFLNTNMLVFILGAFFLLVLVDRFISR